MVLPSGLGGIPRERAVTVRRSPWRGAGSHVQDEGRRLAAAVSRGEDNDAGPLLDRGGVQHHERTALALGRSPPAARFPGPPATALARPGERLLHPIHARRPGAVRRPGEAIAGRWGRPVSRGGPSRPAGPG